MESHILNTGVNTLIIVHHSLHVLCCLGVLSLFNGFVIRVFLLLAFGGRFGGRLIVGSRCFLSRSLLGSLGGLLGGDRSVDGSIGGISLCGWEHGIIRIGGAGPVWTLDGDTETVVTHACCVGLEVVGCTDGVPVDLVGRVSVMALD